MNYFQTWKKADGDCKLSVLDSVETADHAEFLYTKLCVHYPGRKLKG